MTPKNESTAQQDAMGKTGVSIGLSVFRPVHLDGAAAAIDAVAVALGVSMHPRFHSPSPDGTTAPPAMVLRRASTWMSALSSVCDTVQLSLAMATESSSRMRDRETTDCDGLLATPR